MSDVGALAIPNAVARLLLAQGRGELRTGRFELAVETFELVCTLCPGDPVVLAGLAKAYRGAGRPSEADALDDICAHFARRAAA